MDIDIKTLKKEIFIFQQFKKINIFPKKKRKTAAAKKKSGHLLVGLVLHSACNFRLPEMLPTMKPDIKLFHYTI